MFTIMLNKLTIRFIVLGLVILVLVTSVFLWWQDAQSAVDAGDKSTKIFVVERGEGVKTIANRLKAEGLIKDQIGFFLLVKLLKLDSKLQAGDFRLSPGMTVATIAQELTHGSLDVWITIPEGWRMEEIAVKITQELAIPETEFLKYAREGYLFPDTYLIPKDSSASAVVTIFTDNFEKRVTPQLKTDIISQGLTFAQGIVLASIVEREGRTDSDRPIIAGILFNRLHDTHPLQVDATLQYIAGYQSDQKSWWKKELSDLDKKTVSPFNTYLHTGLPPAPIANPGLSSIAAVAHPAVTDYFYYLHDNSGVAHFAKTLEEHNQNIAKYLN